MPSKEIEYKKYSYQTLLSISRMHLKYPKCGLSLFAEGGLRKPRTNKTGKSA